MIMNLHARGPGDAGQALAALPLRPELLAALAALDPTDADHFDRVLDHALGDAAFAAWLLYQAGRRHGGKRSASLNMALLWLGSCKVVDLLHDDVARRPPRPIRDRCPWVHCALVAGLMRRLAPLLRGARIDPQAAYVVGLLHDIGRFLVDDDTLDALPDRDEGTRESAAELDATERALWGATHGEIGHRALLAWGLPVEFAMAALSHHDPGPARGALAALLGDADRLACAVERGGESSLAEFGAGPARDESTRMRYRAGAADLVAVARNAVAESRRRLDRLGLTTVADPRRCQNLDLSAPATAPAGSGCLS